MSNDYLFTSESVSEGHPDKVADQISDAILGAIFEQDSRSRVAAETLTNTGLVVLPGEITTNAHVDYIQVARDTDLPPPCRTKVMEQSPLISENSGYETIQIYR